VATGPESRVDGLVDRDHYRHLEAAAPSIGNLWVLLGHGVEATVTAALVEYPPLRAAEAWKTRLLKKLRELKCAGGCSGK
jgi:hypothetical protein